MLTNLKALVVVLALAWAVFALARPMCLEFMSSEAFVRRRNVWFALTSVAFISPAFWIYALFAMALLYWAGARDDNPLALFVLVTFTVPNVRFYLPGLIVDQLFDLTQYRILSLVILLPVAYRIWNQPQEWGERRLRLPDVLLLAFVVLEIVLRIPYESVTNTMRRSFLLGLDTFVVFYAFSRISGKGRIADVMTCFFLSCAVMAPIAIFESIKGWLLYTGLAGLWGDPNEFAWIGRGDNLRAQAAAGHSLNLGYVLAMGLGFLLYLRPRIPAPWMGWLAISVFATALYMTGSRGPWITAALAMVLFAVLRPGAGRKLAGAAAIGFAIVAVMYLTPLKEAVLDRLPLIGSADQDTVEYRQLLAEVSWQLIKQNPFFGDPFAYLHMESLRQGQGIIDIVNGYIYTALFTGLVGLGLQVGVFLLPVWHGLKASFALRPVDPDAGSMGAALVACMAGSLFFIATAGYGTTTYILCGLLLSYANSHARDGVAATFSVHHSTPRPAPAV